MPNNAIVRALLGALCLSACAHEPTPEPQPVDAGATEETPEVSDNPLFEESTLAYHAPRYDAIRLEHYKPAFERGMQEQLAEIEAIVTNSEAPSFDNTIVALERSGAILRRTNNTFDSLAGTISNDEIQALEAELAPLLSAHGDAIRLNPGLFARVAAVHDGQAVDDAQAKRLVDETYRAFVRAGAKLDDAAKAEIRQINTRLSTLTTTFGQNLLATTKANAVVVDDVATLRGLSEADIAGLAAAANEAGMPGKYLISLLNTTRQPIMARLEDRALRERVWRASADRAQAENGPVIAEIVQLRAKKAELLGFSTWAAYVLDDQMAKTSEAVFGILDDLAPKAVAKAKREAKPIEKLLKKDHKGAKLEPWDWAYYAEKVRAEKFDLDEEEIRNYFELESVLQNGVFFTMERLYGIKFVERKDLPVYHPDVRTFEVFNADGSAIGLFYADYYARDGKRGGAWMSELVGQATLLDHMPVVVNVLNIAKPAAGEPALLSFDEATTMYHEMGHALHGLFSASTYPSLAGTNVPRDYVEFPSQFEEDWAVDPVVVANYTKHYATSEPLPKPLLDKLLASRKFDQGFDSLEYLSSALLDMEWHLIPSTADVSDVAEFERAALAKHGIAFAPVPPRYKSPYFAHVFAGGYSAGYYAYLWTEVLAADAFAYMGTEGGLTRENGDKFRALILSMGNSIDPMEQYKSYRGQAPTVDALLVRRGLD